MNSNSRPESSTGSRTERPDTEALSAADISVVIPAYQASNYLPLCLESLAACRPQAGEILVVFDGEPIDSSSLGHTAQVRTITLSSHQGAAAARNAGARATRGKILMFVDSDVEVPLDIFEGVASMFRTHPEIDALFGSYDDDPGATNFLSQYRNLLHHFVHQTGREQASTFFGACGAIRRAVFEAIGGFDETSKLEDVELGYRLLTAGCCTRLNKQLLVRHNKEWGIWSMLRTDIFLRALPWTELIFRYRNVIDDLNLRRAERASALLVLSLTASILMAFWSPAFLAVAGSLAAALLILNRPLYRFFYSRRGLWFTLGAIPWHWFYFLYSALAFGVGTVLYGLHRSPSHSARRSDSP